MIKISAKGAGEITQISSREPEFSFRHECQVLVTAAQGRPDTIYSHVRHGIHHADIHTKSIKQCFQSAESISPRSIQMANRYQRLWKTQIKVMVATVKGTQENVERLQQAVGSAVENSYLSCSTESPPLNTPKTEGRSQGDIFMCSQKYYSEYSKDEATHMSSGR